MAYHVAVIGMGYVGIAVAVKSAQTGHDVVGIDIIEEKIDKINRGVYPIKGEEPHIPTLLKSVVESGNLRASMDFSELNDRDVIVVCVQTPYDYKNMRPNYEYLKSALLNIGRNMKKGVLVSVESTIAPTTMDKIVKPILEKESNMVAGEDFYLVHCPERVMPGRLLYNLENYGRVIGAINEISGKVARKFYSTIVRGDLDITDMITAEIVKTVENTYRDVQIAFANEIALICERLGANVFEVRKFVNKVVFRDLHIPGAGVGGHCLPKDPLLLLYPVKGLARMVSLAREINNYMPVHVYDLLHYALKLKGVRRGRRLKVAILGASYLSGSDDTRNSPTSILMHKLKYDARGYKFDILVHDPYAPVLFVPKRLPMDDVTKEGEYIKPEKDLRKVVNGADVLILMTAHSEYESHPLDYFKRYMRGNILVDGRNVWDDNIAREKGFLYVGIGKPLPKKLDLKKE